MPIAEIRIPIEDISRQYMLVKDEIAEAINLALPGADAAPGPTLAAFEQEFARYCQAKYCLGITSSNQALNLALAACEINYGDEVITVPNTYAAAIAAICYMGATPVFVDVDPVTFNLDIKQVEARITKKTKAILPVHLYGLPAEMDSLMALARQYNLKVIEDVSHAHGAIYKGRKVGSIGDIGSFSFYPRKILGCYGDGGALVTNDEEVYRRLQNLRATGRHKQFLNEVVGIPQHLDEMQAIILQVKLRYLDHWIERRRHWAALYTDLLCETPVVLPTEPAGLSHVYYQYTLRTVQRDELLKYLTEHGIGAQVMYPLEVPYQHTYQDLGYKPGDFPAADTLVKEILSLPVFPELTDDEVREVAGAIQDFFS